VLTPGSGFETPCYAMNQQKKEHYPKVSMDIDKKQ
jgi:hypothetical protein